MSLCCHLCSVPVQNPFATIEPHEAIFFFWPKYEGKKIKSRGNFAAYHGEHLTERIPKDELRTQEEILDLLRPKANARYKELVRESGALKLCTSVNFPFYSISENMGRTVLPALQRRAEQGIVSGERQMYLFAEVEETIPLFTPPVSTKIIGYITEETGRKYLPEFFREFEDKMTFFAVETSRGKKVVVA